MSLIEKILESSDEEIDSIISDSIHKHNQNANQTKILGFSNFSDPNSVFKGFIPLEARIKYSSLGMEDYSMGTTDFIYEFAHFVKKYRINSVASLIYNLEYFVNSYFDYPGKASREVIFDTIAWKTSKTDEEYFTMLENNKIGDLKGKGAAECTERSALVQQILSIFGIESYYCMGCVDYNRQEPHCFNIVKRKKDYALLDYSLPVASFDVNGNIVAYYPFIASLTNEEFEDFIENNTIKSFEDYSIKNNKIEKNGNQRLYVIGKYKMEKHMGRD